MNSVELFAGAGGLALAGSHAGFKHMAIVERDRYACETIKANKDLNVKPIRDWPEVTEADVRHFDYRELEDKVQVVAGGPPCQPFSLGGRHGAYNDSRDLFPEAVRAVRELRPQAFIFENVRGLMRRSFSTYFEYITLQLQHPELIRSSGESWHDHLYRLEEFHTRGSRDGLGYNVVFQILNAANYGVPQRRERVFIVGFRNDMGVGFSFPKPTHSLDALLWRQFATGEYWDTHKVSRTERPARPNDRFAKRVDELRGQLIPPSEKPWRTVREAISDLPDPRSLSARAVANHVFQAGARAYPGHTGSQMDEPAKTLKAGSHGVPGGENMLVLPSGQMRYFTVRESARLQTFPEDVFFPGSWTETMRQLGNAVPTELGYVVTSAVAAQLRRAGRAA